MKYIKILPQIVGLYLGFKFQTSRAVLVRSLILNSFKIVGSNLGEFYFHTEAKSAQLRN